MNEQELGIFVDEIRILFETRAPNFGLEYVELESVPSLFGTDVCLVRVVEPISRWDRAIVFNPALVCLLRCSLPQWVDSGLEEARKSFWGRELVG